MGAAPSDMLAKADVQAAAADWLAYLKSERGLANKTIEAYRIRNKEVKDSPIDGVPYPGTFLVGQDGIIHAKLFYDGYKKRHHAKDIIKATEKLPKKKAD